MRWLKNPKIRISINSKRGKEDPLYFNPVNLVNDPSYHDISLLTDPRYHDKQFLDMVFRRTFEETLRVLVLIMAIICTWSQLHYINSFVVDPIAYASLVLIYTPAVDYISPLIGTRGIFFKWNSFQTHIYQTYDFVRYERFLMLDCVIKVLSLYARLLTFNLDKKVSASRIQHISLGNNQLSRLPYEKKNFPCYSCYSHHGISCHTHYPRKERSCNGASAWQVGIWKK